MVIGVFIFVISWLAFFIFSRRKKCIYYTFTSYLGVILALMTDLLVTIIPLWNYPGTHWEQFGISILNAFGIYFVVIYLFLQTLPEKQTILSLVRHIFYWSLISITIELFCLAIGFIEHDLWWNTGISYISDWILFITFYIHHKLIMNLLHKK